MSRQQGRLSGIQHFKPRQCQLAPVQLARGESYAHSMSHPMYESALHSTWRRAKGSFSLNTAQTPFRKEFCPCDNKHNHTLVLKSLQAPLRNLADGGAGFCSIWVPVLLASQEKHWSPVWKEGKDGAGPMTVGGEIFLSDLCSSPYLFSPFLVATAA